MAYQGAVISAVEQKVRQELVKAFTAFPKWANVTLATQVAKALDAVDAVLLAPDDRQGKNHTRTESNSAILDFPQGVHPGPLLVYPIPARRRGVRVTRMRSQGEV